MERDDNAEKGRQVNDAYSKNNSGNQDKDRNNHPQQNLREEDSQRSQDKYLKNKDIPDSLKESKEGFKKDEENQTNGLDEDLKAQERGSYGHKSQEDAEKDGRGKK